MSAAPYAFPHRPRAPRRCAQGRATLHPARGMALVAVLWLVAAMAVLATGLTGTVRQQVQLTTAIRDQATARAVGEAAQVLVLQAMRAKRGGERPSAIETVNVNYGGQDVAVEVMPLDGLISLNGADEALLTKVFAVAGQLPAGAASTLAKAAITWRDERPENQGEGPRSAGSGKRDFESVEDLMLVPGIDYDLYHRVAPVLTADLAGGRQVNVAAAPPEVLAVLADGQAGVVERVQAARARGDGASVDYSGLGGGARIRGATDHYRLTARVPITAGKMLVLTQVVALGQAYSRTAPWRVARSSWQMSTASP